MRFSPETYPYPEEARRNPGVLRETGTRMDKRLRPWFKKVRQARD